MSPNLYLLFCREEQRDYDFLSSIEILILDQTDVYFMQNWQHIGVNVIYIKIETIGGKVRSHTFQMSKQILIIWLLSLQIVF